MKHQAATGAQPRPFVGEVTLEALRHRLRSFAGAFRSLETRLLLVLLAVALLVQVVYYLRIQAVSPPYGLTTEHYYSPLAINLLHHGTYGFGEYPDIQKTTKRPPFYSVVLAGVYGLFGEDERYGLVLNNIFLWLTIIVAYLIGRTLGPGIGLIAALLYALDPVGLINANNSQAGALYGLLFALFFLVTLRTFTSSVTLRRSLLSSLLLGLATFTRAATLYFGVPLVLAFFVAHRWFIRRVSLPRLIVLILALFSVQALIIGAWMTRNNTVSGNSDFAGMTVVHLYSYYVPLVIAKKEGIRYEEARARLADELASDREYLSIERGGDKQQYVVRKSIGLIIRNPISAALVILEQIPVVFLNYPQDAASIFLSEERRETIEALLSERVRRKTSRLDISGYGDIFRQYVDNGFGPAAGPRNRIQALLPRVHVGRRDRHHPASVGP